jgi:hypothetical protein
MSFLVDILKTTAPVLASLVGSPLAGAAVAFLGKALLGNSSSSVEEIAVALKDPAMLIKLRELENQIPLALLAQQTAQINVNAKEAENTNLFVAGWRPFIGWGLGSIIIFYALATTVLSILTALNVNLLVMPPLDPMVRDIVIGLLGLNIGTRTVEKFVRKG